MKHVIKKIVEDLNVFTNKENSESDKVFFASRIFESIANEVTHSIRSGRYIKGGYLKTLQYLETEAQDAEKGLAFYKNKNNIEFIHNLRKYRNKIHPDKAFLQQKSSEEPKIVSSQETAPYLFEITKYFFSAATNIEFSKELKYYNDDAIVRLVQYLKVSLSRDYKINEEFSNAGSSLSSIKSDNSTQFSNTNKKDLFPPKSKKLSGVQANSNHSEFSKKRKMEKLKILGVGLPLLIALVFMLLYFLKPTDLDLQSIAPNKNSDPAQKPLNPPENDTNNNDALLKKDSVLEITKTSEESIEIKEEGNKSNQVKGNQINFGNGNKFNNSNVSGGDMDIDSKKE